MAPNDQSPLDVTEKYAIGQPVSRMEDPVLLTGRGRYTDDINLTGQAYGVMVRSQIAHGVIDAIDLEEARAMPGVLAIYTVADMDAAGYGNLLCGAGNVNRDGSPMIKPPRATLARERVRHVGDPIAFVVAETRAQARDAADAVFVDINPLTAVSDPLAAVAAGAPQIWPERRATSPSISTMATATRSPPLSPAPRMSRAWTWSTTASWFRRWSRGWRWSISTRQPISGPCAPAAKVCSACTTGLPN